MFHESYYLQICERYVKKHKIDVYTPGKINHWLSLWNDSSTIKWMDTSAFGKIFLTFKLSLDHLILAHM